MDFLPASFFIHNRSKLKELLLPSSAVIISSNRPMRRNGDQNYPYRQSSDLYYLCGLRQEQCTLIIYPDSGPGNFGEILFIPEGDKRTNMWEGELLSDSEARGISGIQNIKAVREIKEVLKKILSDCSYVYFGMPEEEKSSSCPSNEKEIRLEFQNRLEKLEEHELGPLMTRIRMYKEAEEISMMKKAISITGDAFIRVLQNLRPDMMEYQAAAMLSYEFHLQGTREHAFDPILASGKNALVLHYCKNNSRCKDGDLLLMDFGADWEYYAADVSRTIPINGRYTKRQRELYDANLRVLKNAMKLMRPGIFISELNQEVGKLWEEEHLRLGLYSREESRKQAKIWPLWQKYYWHGTSHSIGIDVHDPFDHSLKLGAGMVLSCEPGIYISEEGIGIRLENDILITNDGSVNLSENIPVDPDAIEVIMNKS